MCWGRATLRQTLHTQTQMQKDHFDIHRSLANSQQIVISQGIYACLCQ